ncbi:phosphomevalonate kinase [Lacticaseibacillus sp. 866-1]|uniref:phosphomevalonate kinase n=1 Tax=Lacticaseibacillus sp. 866-1 TaxID=2799576 RepID=UPI0019443308|nr:phosphomevalonate kinase [Lacticaseibacillus sp. 866-1]
MVTAQAPGKLYIAGEYAVVETGYPAIIVALNQFVTVTVEQTENYGSIVSKQYREDSILWQRQGDAMVFDNRDNPFHYILSAIKLTEQYARELGKPLALYDLFVDSDLDSESGKKYGLGSSAAVTVATVKALNEFYELQMTKDEIYKLSAIAHLEIQKNGSLGDIAASVYGGWIAFTTFDKTWLAAEMRLHSLAELIRMPWPELSIEELTAPNQLQLLIGWTGSPASTSRLVDKIAVACESKKDEYSQFLKKSRAIVSKMIEGFHAHSLDVIQQEIRSSRKALESLAELSGVEIETNTLIKLADLAEKSGAAGKSSGAGGGDCGIAIIDRSADASMLAKAWASHGIEVLDFKVHDFSTV